MTFKMKVYEGIRFFAWRTIIHYLEDEDLISYCRTSRLSHQLCLEEIQLRKSIQQYYFSQNVIREIGVKLRYHGRYTFRRNPYGSIPSENITTKITADLKVHIKTRMGFKIQEEELKRWREEMNKTDYVVDNIFSERIIDLLYGLMTKYRYYEGGGTFSNAEIVSDYFEDDQAPSTINTKFKKCFKFHSILERKKLFLKGDRDIDKQMIE